MCWDTTPIPTNTKTRAGSRVSEAGTAVLNVRFGHNKIPQPHTAGRGFDDPLPAALCLSCGRQNRSLSKQRKLERFYVAIAIKQRHAGERTGNAGERGFSRNGLRSHETTKSKIRSMERTSQGAPWKQNAYPENHALRQYAFSARQNRCATE